MCLSFFSKKKVRKEKNTAPQFRQYWLLFSDKVKIYYFIVKNAASVKDADKVAACFLNAAVDSYRRLVDIRRLIAVVPYKNK